MGLHSQNRLIPQKTQLSVSPLLEFHKQLGIWLERRDILVGQHGSISWQKDANSWGSSTWNAAPCGDSFIVALLTYPPEQSSCRQFDLFGRIYAGSHWFELLSKKQTTLKYDLKNNRHWHFIYHKRPIHNTSTKHKKSKQELCTLICIN